MAGKAVLAYSGGLDTSVAIKWIRERYGLDVVTCTVDVGQGEDLSEIGKKAGLVGAINHHLIDAKEEFVRDYVLKSIRANSLYEGEYPNSTALARPLLASKLVEVAEEENAIAVAHGCTGKGNDQVRFDVSIKALNPDLKIIAPVREWNLNRDEEMQYAKKNGIPYSPSSSLYSIDQNLWGRSIEGGPLEDPYSEPPEEAFEWCVSPRNSPQEPEYLEIDFERGIPVGIDGRKVKPIDLINYVNSKAGLNGYGIIDHVENRLVGIKSREVYECPGALTLIHAHRDLEKLVLTKHELNFKKTVEEKWTSLVYEGLWVEPLRAALENFIDKTQERVSGTVRVKLWKGTMRIVGRRSRNSLYEQALSTYAKGSTFNQKAAEGFIELWGLPSRVASSKSTAAAENMALVPS
jgi:argininosuccinate synthase